MSEITIECTNPGEISDGYHTFNELYEHRHALFLSLMASSNRLAYCWMSQIHDDSSAIDGWFIAGINLPTGTVSYHLPMRLWGLAKDTGATVLDKAPKWDGHTPQDVIVRLKALVANNKQ